MLMLRRHFLSKFASDLCEQEYQKYVLELAFAYASRRLRLRYILTRSANQTQKLATRYTTLVLIDGSVSLQPRRRRQA